MKIAFIGLGNMGGGMAANLVKAGHEVRAFDLSEPAREAAEGHGCTVFTDAKQAVDGAEAVVTMLPNGAIVKSVLENDVFGHAPQGALILDCSTIDVATTRALNDAASAKGYVMADAPVSGGIAAANGGTLTFMVGGTDEAFARAEPILSGMGKAVIHAGQAGAGEAAKLCNNLILAATMIATCEGFALAEKLGLDPQVFYDISSKATGQSWSMTSYCPVPGVGPQAPSDNGYHGGFATALMLKDLKLAMEAAEGAGVNTRIGRRAKELYEAFDAAGNGGLDFSAIIKTME
jgi:3-hydroxyisobutyrate dehydrogenase